MYVYIRIKAVRDPRQRVCVHVQTRDCNVRGIMEAANCLGCCSGTYIKLLQYGGPIIYYMPISRQLKFSIPDNSYPDYGVYES